MRNLIFQLWHDEYGAILSAELVVIATLLVIGLVVGLTCLQSAVVDELTDTACAIGSLDQSYQYAGFRNTGRWWSGCIKSWKAGSSYLDVDGTAYRNSTRLEVRENDRADFGCRPGAAEVPQPPACVGSPHLSVSPSCPTCPTETWTAPCVPCQPGPVEPVPLLTPPTEAPTPVPVAPEPAPYESPTT